MKFKIFLLALLVTLASTAEARYVKKCSVKYLTENGWSKSYVVDVTFMTGYELNTATKSLNYDTFKLYGIVFWSREEVTIIGMRDLNLCGTEVTEDCIKSSIMDFKGSDQQERDWSVCVTDYCL